MKKYIVAPGFWGWDLTADVAAGYGGKVSFGRTATVPYKYAAPCWQFSLGGTRSTIDRFTNIGNVLQSL